MSDMETNDSQKNMSYTASLAEEEQQKFAALADSWSSSVPVELVERKQSPHPSVS